MIALGVIVVVLALIGTVVAILLATDVAMAMGQRRRDRIRRKARLELRTRRWS